MDKDKLLNFLTAFMSDEIVDKVSTFSWKLYRSLIDKGFTKEDAKDIMLNYVKPQK